MRPTSRGGVALACFAALVLGGFVSLFSAGIALFGDGAFAERPPILAGSVVAFALLGLVLGASAPAAWKPVAVCLALSGIPVVVLFGADSFGQVPMMVLAGGFLLGDAAAGTFGAWAGARLRARGSL